MAAARAAFQEAAMATEIHISKEAREARERGRRVFAEIRPRLPVVPSGLGPFIERLNTEINAALADAKIKARLADLGSIPLPLRASGYAKLLADETEKWGKVVKFSGAKAE
jgi:hypothetical protein